jgi:alpha-L-fucosidase
MPAHEIIVPSRTTWFEDARFAMFIHFGLYSIPAGIWQGKRMGRNDYAEWIRWQMNWPDGPMPIPKTEYDTLLSQFNPKGFDADAWMAAAKRAGMKYLVVTTKHHDGFALWNSRVSDYNTVKATPFARDLVGELTTACRKLGLKVGFYYSHWLDWEYPGGGLPPWAPAQPTQEEYERYWTNKCLAQVRELLGKYSPDLFWFDSWGDASHFLTKDRLLRLIGLVREIKPDCLINSRIGTEHGIDFISMNDNEFPEKALGRPWETAGTLNESWGYHQLDKKFRTRRELLRNLVDNVSRGGNYQLNVGPTGDGDFQPEVTALLDEIGRWMQTNGDAIYGTRVAPYPEPAWGRLTQKTLPDGDYHLYVFLYDVEPGTLLELTGPDSAPAKTRTRPLMSKKPTVASASTLLEPSTRP